MFDHIRYPLRLPSRKGKKKRDNVPILFRPKGSNTLERQTIATAESPTGLCLPTIPPANLQLGLPEFVSDSIPVGVWRFGPPLDKMPSVAKQLGADAIAAHFDLPAFARLIAKIGYAYAVAELRLDGFRPIATDLILGKAENWNYLVGLGHPIEINPTNARVNHAVALQIQTFVEGENYLIGRVQLFSNFGAPCYNAVIGSLTSNQVEKIQRY